MPPTNDQHITYNCTSKELEQLYHAYARHAGVSDAALWLLYVIRLGGNNLTQAGHLRGLALSPADHQLRAQAARGAGPRRALPRGG